jgi:hypothetical protein
MTTITLPRVTVEAALDDLIRCAADAGNAGVDDWPIFALRAALEQPQSPKTNQCAEVCERAKMCAICARGLEQPQAEPLQDRVQLCRYGGTNTGDMLTQPCNCQPEACRLGRRPPGADDRAPDHAELLACEAMIEQQRRTITALMAGAGDETTPVIKHIDRLEALLAEARDALIGCERGACIMLWAPLVARIDAALGAKP